MLIFSVVARCNIAFAGVVGFFADFCADARQGGFQTSPPLPCPLVVRRR